MDDPSLYGYLIVLGTNGKNLIFNPKDERYTNKLVLVKRAKANGIKSSKIQKEYESSKSSEAFRSQQLYTVGYKVDKKVCVEQYVEDASHDMYQMGRCADEQIDLVLSSYGNLDKKGHDVTIHNETVSRYACRILVDRQPPHQARIYAAGFDTNRNILLGDNSVKWRSKEGTIDAFTTNGVLIRYPDNEFYHEQMDNFASHSTENGWKEISVSGAVYQCYSRRGIAKNQFRLKDDSNVLIDGTLIDLCGLTLMWRSNKYCDSEVTYDLQSMCDKMNEAHIQCPVEYRTLRISPNMLSYDTTHRNHSSPPKSPIFKFPYKAFFHRRRVTNSSSSSSSKSKGDNNHRDDHASKPPQPFVYLSCGHVVGTIAWKNYGDTENSRTCPCCRTRGPLVKLRLVQESAFFINLDTFSYCFNPCGHMGSEATVKYWSNITIPSTMDSSFISRCPFCYRACDKPVRLFFQ